MTFEETKAATIAHYERMIAWESDQYKGDQCDSDIMYQAIDESWYSDCCPMCNEYLGVSCDVCPIFKKTGKGNCEGTPWQKMSTSETWGKWLIHAKLELKFIKSLEAPI